MTISKETLDYLVLEVAKTSYQVPAFGLGAHNRRLKDFAIALLDAIENETEVFTHMIFRESWQEVSEMECMSNAEQDRALLIKLPLVERHSND